MAENNILEIEDDALKEEAQEKKSFTHYLFIFLKYLLFLVLLGIFVTVISVITVRTLQKQSSITNTAGPIALNTQQTVPEELDWYTQIGEIRGTLRDVTRKTYIADVFIGYEIENQLSLQEIIRRRVQIRERITLYLNEHYSKDLEGSQNILRVKNELREIINRTMNNKIREVAFNAFQIIEF